MFIGNSECDVVFQHALLLPEVLHGLESPSASAHIEHVILIARALAARVQVVIPLSSPEHLLDAERQITS